MASQAKRNTIHHHQMKTSTLVPALALLALAFPARLQAENPGNGTITERIEEVSEGRITVEVPAEVLEKILENPEPTKRPSTGASNRGGYGRTSGFRIQVFADGRSQHSLEARAKARGSAIVAKFPKYRGQVYTQSQSPNWYTRIGNFRTQAEASAALEELKRAFPQFSSEMRVVKAKITVQ